MYNYAQLENGCVVGVSSLARRVIDDPRLIPIDSDKLDVSLLGKFFDAEGFYSKTLSLTANGSVITARWVSERNVNDPIKVLVTGTEIELECYNGFAVYELDAPPGEYAIRSVTQYIESVEIKVVVV